MVDTRTVTLPALWADDAITEIPTPPVANTTYRNTDLGSTELLAGWPYQKIVDSADFNQTLWLISNLVKSCEQYGIMPWCASTTYKQNGICLASNGIFYWAKKENTGVNPVTDSGMTNWGVFLDPGDNFVTETVLMSQINLCEKLANKVQALSSSSTTTQYPSAKCVYDNINNLQTSKQNNITGGASTITSANLTADRVLVSSDSGKVDTAVNITRNELNMLDGVTSNIQNQLNGKQASGSYMTTNTDQGITGTKVFNGASPIKLGKAGGTYTEVQFTSDGSARLGGLRNIREGNSDNMQMYVAAKDGESILGSIQINRDDNNGILATAPHPAASTNYNNPAIMTAGRAADPKQNFNLLHRSGDEIFSGVKTVQSNNPCFGFKHTEIDVTTAPAEQKSTRIFFSDKNNKWISEIGVYKNTDDGVVSQITANNDTAGVASLQIICKKDGSKYGTCPTPPAADDNSTKISTTQWVNSRITSIMNNKLQVVSSLPSSPNADTFYFIPEK